MTSQMMLILVLSGVGLLSLLVILFILSRLYARASKEISFVRTGFGGQKVIMNGGALVFPVFHEIIPVNMNTLRLEVRRINEQALITRDRMRVDVQAEFYVRVKPTEESIANAAQTLGKRTMNPQSLKELVEGKFVDALRAVAAEMAIEELHEQRVDFVQKVQTAVMEDLLKNGLELESVSLTALDQTDQSYFNPQNIFDAQGLTKLTEEIQERKKQRNDIERHTELEIQKKDLDTKQKSLELSKEEQYAQLEQQREIQIREAQQQSQIASEQAGKEREAKEAQIKSKQQVQQAELDAQRLVQEKKIANEQLLKQKDIERSRVIDTEEIERQKNVALADQVREIAIAEKSKEKSVAESEANLAKSKAVRSEEQVATAREAEIAERAKTIELIEARKQAEKDAIAIVVAAEAEKQAAEDQKEAAMTRAQGHAESLKINAKAEADAEIMKAEAEKIRYTAEAEGKQALFTAENSLSSDVIAMRIKMALIENLDSIIRESVKPMENIESIKVLQLDGGLNGVAGSSGEPGPSGMSDQLVNSALRYRGQAPLVDSLLKELGINGGDIQGFTAPFTPEVVVGNQVEPEKTGDLPAEGE